MLKTILIFAFSFSQLFTAKAQLTINAAYIDNRINPTGVGLQGFRFGWELSANGNDQLQTAYELGISSSLVNLSENRFDVYTSPVVNTPQSVLIDYKGKALMPGQAYYWKVRVWDKQKKQSAWSAPQHFVTGLFTDKDWSGAQWIGLESLPDSMRIVPGIHALSSLEFLGDKNKKTAILPLFRKTFKAKKKIREAIAFITGLGHYEMSINGKKAQDAFLAPGWTQYDKTVLYNTYDISHYLQNGDNAIGIVVGNGFHYISRKRYFKLTNAYGFPKMICRIKLTYTDGSSENIVSDESWKTAPSPIVFTSIFGGEDYDASLEQPHWNEPVFDDSKWKKIVTVAPPKGRLVPELDFPVRLLDSFRVRKISPVAGKGYCYDFGQNLSGIPSIRIQGKKGQTVRLTAAELIHADGSPNQVASGEPFNFTYTLSGSGEEHWQPSFTYYGFRYLVVEGAVPDTADNRLGLPVIKEALSLHNRNSSPSNGSFNCSNPLFNRIFKLIDWSVKSNLQSVVTDCPHREKLSWLEQDYLMGASIHYNYDVYQLYRKLVTDLMDAQYEKGFVPDIAPEYVVFEDGFLDSPEWGSAAVILPWLLYEWYGDKDILAKAYPMTKRYVDYLSGKANNHILSHGLGDWFDYGPKQPGVAQLTPIHVTATSIYYYDLTLVAKMAAVLEKDADAIKYQELAAEVGKSFNAEFFNSQTNVYSTGSQTAMAMPLCVGLVAEKDKSAVLKNLVDSIYKGNKALTAGDIGFHFLVKALDDGGMSQLIYDMNNRDDVPGYGFQLRKGATALTESWPALENVSNNHLMLGHIMEWFYSGLAGIGQEENSVAFQQIRIRPQPVGDIHAAEGSFHSPYGWIHSSWLKREKRFMLEVSIPINAKANVYLPVSGKAIVRLNGKTVEETQLVRKPGSVQLSIGSGKYSIVADE